MASIPKPIDIDDHPELLSLAREVQETGEPRELRAEGEAVALVVPIVGREEPTRSYPWREKTEADYEAFRSAAGGWKGLVDVEKFKRDNAESRRISTRPPVDL
jgi:hypothetical protein